MKLIAYLIMTVCLCLGTLAATVAYSPKLSMSDEMLLTSPPLTLNAEAGVASFGGDPALIPLAQGRSSITPFVIETTLGSPTAVSARWNSEAGLAGARSLSFARASGLLDRMNADMWDAHGASPEGYSHFLVATGLLGREIEPIRTRFEKGRFTRFLEENEAVAAAFEAWHDALEEFAKAGDEGATAPARPAAPGLEQDASFGKYWREWSKEVSEDRKDARRAAFIDEAKDQPEAARALRGALESAGSDATLESFVGTLPGSSLRDLALGAKDLKQLRFWVKEAIKAIEKAEAEKKALEALSEEERAERERKKEEEKDPRGEAASPAYPPAIAWLDSGVVVGIVPNGAASSFEPVLGDAALAHSFLASLSLSDGAVKRLAPASNFTEAHLKNLEVSPDDLLTGPIDGLTPVTLLDANMEITPVQLALLRDAGVGRVRIKEFSFARWDMAWMMGAACLGLGIAAFMVKMATREEIRAELAQPSSHEDSPSKSLGRVVATVDELVRAVNSSSDDHARNELVINRIGALQKNELATLADSRTTLVAVLSLSGYAKFMDRFSMMERLLNRAWSAAADEVTAEAVLCLNEAQELMPQVVAAMKPGS